MYIRPIKGCIRSATKFPQFILMKMHLYCEKIVSSVRAQKSFKRFSKIPKIRDYSWTIKVANR